MSETKDDGTIESVHHEPSTDSVDQQSSDPDIQQIVEKVDEHLQAALEHANRYHSHDEIRPSAAMAFEEVDEARRHLDRIDERDFIDDE